MQIDAEPERRVRESAKEKGKVGRRDWNRGRLSSASRRPGLARSALTNVLLPRRTSSGEVQDGLTRLISTRLVLASCTRHVAFAFWCALPRKPFILEASSRSFDCYSWQLKRKVKIFSFLWKRQRKRQEKKKTGRRERENEKEKAKKDSAK